MLSITDYNYLKRIKYIKDKDKQMNGKIYRIGVGDYWYIGSTIQSLKQRLKVHKCYAKRNPTQKLYKKILELGWDNVRIQLIENYSCNNRSELFIRESFYINTKSPLNLNSKQSFQSNEDKSLNKILRTNEWRNNNKERFKLYRTEYQNRDSVKEYRKQYAKTYKLTQAQKERKQLWQIAYRSKINIT